MGIKTGNPRGRPKGSTGKDTIERRQRLESAAEKMHASIPNLFTGDAHMLLMMIYKDIDQPLPIRLDAAKSAIRYEVPALATVESKQDPEQFAKEQAAKVEQMDVMEIARRMAFILAEANHQMTKPAPDAVVTH